MNNGYNQNGRQMPRGNGQQRPPQARPKTPAPDPRMMQVPPTGGQAPRQAQPARDPRMAQGRQMPPRGTRDPRMAQNSAEQMRTRALNDTHRKATREQMREDNKRRRKDSRNLFLGRLALYGILVVILAGIVISGFACVFYSTPDENESSVNFIEKYDGKTGISSKVSGDLAYRNGELYVNFSSIAEGCSMSVIQSSDNAKFIIPDGDNTSDAAGSGHEEYVYFTKDSREVVVCGQDFRLTDVAVFSGGEVWIPAEFVENYVNGITVSEDRDSGNVYITREKDESEVEGEESPLAEISFKLKAVTAPDPTEPPEGVDTVGGMPEVTFSTNLYEYEKYMNPDNAKEYLVLVNKTTTVDGSYKPDDLTAISNTRKDGRETQKMREHAAKALDAMFIEMKAAGYTDVSVTSAYRSYEYQSQLYTSYTNKEMNEHPGWTKEQAQAEVDTYSARPGTSEHQTGLCADLHNLGSADQAFANEKAYKWLCDNAWKFGFILRFPEDKTEQTGYSFEPWHYRFVGRNAAWQIHSKGLCLEEFLAG